MDIDALLAEHLGPVRRKFERDKVLAEQLRTVEMEIRSPDRTVTIKQTCAGEILDVEIAPGAFAKHDERSLAKILTAALQSGRRTGRQAAEQFADEIMQEQEARRGL